jgi:flagellar motor component MotA
VQLKFGEKARNQMREKQAAGSTAKKGAKREAKNFDALFLSAQHISEEGWNGIPASAFRHAMVEACTLVDFHKTKAKKAVFVDADGYDKDFIRNTLECDRDNFLQRLDEGSKVYRAIGDCAPAWGMIGTILGMVTMFATMSDPSKLGPAMATALLATLYGAVIANAIATPIADKLHVKIEEEEISRTLIIDGILQIRDAKSPTLIREMLMAYLPDHHRTELAEA